MQRRIRKGLLREALAIVEGAGDRYRRDVAAERRELRFLNVADLAFGIQHDDARAGDAKEGVGDRAAGVA